MNTTAKTNNDKVKVVFLKTPKDPYCPSEVMAFFPEVDWNIDGTMKGCYVHNGQHGPCQELYALQDCKPAKEKDYAALRRELVTQVGYTLVVLDAKVWQKSNGKRKQELRQIDRDNFTMGKLDNGGAQAA